MSEPSLPEPLEDFLQHPPQAPLDAGLQASMLAQTSAQLQPPVGAARWPLVAAAAAIAIGMVATYFIWRYDAPQQQGKIAERKHETREEKPPGTPMPHEKPAPQWKQTPVLAPPTTTNPRDLEWAAFDAEDDAERAKLYFQAGDFYLDKHQDYASAARCYRQALANSNVRELEFNSNDNWLVMAVKRDLRKEN